MHARKSSCKHCQTLARGESISESRPLHGKTACFWMTACAFKLLQGFHIEPLCMCCRNAARESFQAVKQQEDRGSSSVKGPASEYLHAVMPSYYQSGGGNKAAPLRAAEAALKANNYTCLTSSESMRYATTSPLHPCKKT